MCLVLLLVIRLHAAPGSKTRQVEDVLLTEPLRSPAMLILAAVADSNSVVFSTPLRMELQLWMLDERMMQTMFLVAIALKKVVQ